MTLSQQIIKSRIHHEQHLTNRLRSEDPCCPIRHPIGGEIPDNFTLVALLVTEGQLHNITLPQRDSILSG